MSDVQADEKDLRKYGGEYFAEIDRIRDSVNNWKPQTEKNARRHQAIVLLGEINRLRGCLRGIALGCDALMEIKCTDGERGVLLGLQREAMSVLPMGFVQLKGASRDQ